MAQQTALSWYIEQHKILSSKTDDMPISELVVKIKDIEIQAKEMEKQQKIGLLKWMNKVASEEPMRLETDFDDIVEQYYTETYGK